MALRLLREHPCAGWIPFDDLTSTPSSAASSARRSPAPSPAPGTKCRPLIDNDHRLGL